MTTTRPFKVIFSAGESSGDRHAAHMFLELKSLHPDIEGLGMGGAAMREAGIDIRCDSSNIGVIGVVEVLKHYREIRQALKQMQRLLVDERPDLLVCVDYKEFNFKLAKFAKSIGVKVLFYVSPQVWAWRPGRVKQYGQVIDKMAVIFPFETAYYEAENVPVSYVGHPSIDKVHPRYTKHEDLDRFGLDGERPVIGLMPGSRKQEIERLLPVMLDAASIVLSLVPGAQFILPQAQSVSDELLRSYLDRSELAIKVIKNETYDAVQCCTAIMTSSGTATLEIALLQVPMVIVYKLSELTYWLGRLLVKTPFIGLPNIVAGKAVAKELIQHQANAKNMADEIVKLLSDRAYYDAVKSDLIAIKNTLGSGEGSKNMAILALEMLTEK
ncbi:lipid-A-disaccharide synthase [Methylotuvimicrobium alcaliphilum]|uniref:Lipid-A-disaccharide synthase n=1 Tax=Methylotuvimicrobium alcaliphilum (strain DSM 19304 / NCIMB 14124 / VKM B-2133 / 20Z) TaxID=1091494 RepID=G4T0C3_META2|nr:lipid-A-disaccharide synthase [Methylotuvimicrobium alcaliphilum]CCE24515.1 Lipid-A-disaccharide synthase [Methylotuvimicrobium alcaliphilum 20Z]